MDYTVFNYDSCNFDSRPQQWWALSSMYRGNWNEIESLFCMFTLMMLEQFLISFEGCTTITRKHFSLGFGFCYYTAYYFRRGPPSSLRSTFVCSWPQLSHTTSLTLSLSLISPGIVLPTLTLFGLRWPCLHSGHNPKFSDMFKVKVRRLLNIELGMHFIRFLKLSNWYWIVLMGWCYRDGRHASKWLSTHFEFIWACKFDSRGVNF
jgi:hypothetical protein